MKKIFTLFLFFAFVKTAFSQFSNPMDFSLFPYTLNGKEWGYCDKERSVIIAPRYESAPFFQTIDKTVLAVVGIQKKYGLIDTTGKEILPLGYDEIRFCDNLLVLRKKNKRWLADANGKFIQNLIGEPACFIQHQMGYCGGVIYRPQPFRLNYYTITGQIETYQGFNAYKMLYITEKNGDTKQIDTLYRLNEREQIDSFTRAHYEKEFEWSTRKDWWAIKNDILWKNNQYALKSRQLTDIKIDSQKWTKTIEFTKYQTPFQYDSIKQVGPNFFIKKDKKLGVFNRQAQQMIPIEYDAITQGEMGFIVKKGKMYGLKNGYGKPLLPLEYDFIDVKIAEMERNDDKFKAKKNGLWGVYDKGAFAVQLPHIYKEIDFSAYYFIKATLANGASFYVKFSDNDCYQEMYPNGSCHKPQPLK
jgi:WG containing repeat